ncbi:MAG: hypothetical protein U1C89_05885 [Methylotenera sp.]|nr:hypothetical protein [Methylotenera sp.]MDP2403056.1 hypothetical protein [Methylotenera sp.]MDZ4223014.1 hypothetical protein [Methylotenera sp.]
MRHAWDTKSKKNKYGAEDREPFYDKHAHSVASRSYHQAKQCGFFSGKNILESLEQETQYAVGSISRRNSGQYKSNTSEDLV